METTKELIVEGGKLVEEKGWMPSVPLEEAPSLTIGQVLEAAADRLERRGWVPFLPYGWEECAGIAILRATAPDQDESSKSYPVDYEMGNKACIHLQTYLGIENIVDWNDQQRDIRVVTRTLREAAATAPS